MIIEICKETAQARLVSMTEEELLSKDDIYVLASTPNVLLDERNCMLILKQLNCKGNLYFLVPESKNRVSLKVICDNKLNLEDTVQKNINKFQKEVLYKKEAYL